MKRIGVLGGISPQATMDFEARVHRVAQRLVPQHWNTGYPPMAVWYHRRLPVRRDDDGRTIVPMEVDPQLVEAAAVLGQAVDFLVIPCNAAHVGLRAIGAAAGRPVLSMIDVTLEEIGRRGWTRPGVVGFGGPPRVYLDPLEQRGLRCATIDPALQARLDGGIRAVMEGAEGAAERAVARDAVGALRGAGVDGVVLGCTEIPLLLGEASEDADLVNPLALLAEATVRLAMEEARTVAAAGAR
jgi:aspartate racemase